MECFILMCHVQMLLGVVVLVSAQFCHQHAFAQIPFFDNKKNSSPNLRETVVDERLDCSSFCNVVLPFNFSFNAVTGHCICGDLDQDSVVAAQNYVYYSTATTHTVEFLAQSVVSFSSEYTDDGKFRAVEVLGAPNVYPEYGDLDGAWARDETVDDTPWIEISFSEAIRVLAVHIYETYCPGFIKEVSLGSTDNLTWTIVWSAAAPQTVPPESRIFIPNFTPLNVLTDAVKIQLFFLDTSCIYPEIDAVQVVGEV